MMIEGFGDFLTVDEMLYAIEKGHEAVANACREIERGRRRLAGTRRRRRCSRRPTASTKPSRRLWASNSPRRWPSGNKFVAPRWRKFATRRWRRSRRTIPVRVGRSGRDAIPVAPIRFRFFFLSRRDGSFSPPFSSRFSRPTTTARALTEGPRRVPLVEPKATGPTAEGTDCTPRVLRTRARPTPGVAPGDFRCRRFARARHLADPTRGASAHSERPSRHRSIVRARLSADRFSPFVPSSLAARVFFFRVD